VPGRVGLVDGLDEAPDRAFGDADLAPDHAARAVGAHHERVGLGRAAAEPEARARSAGLEAEDARLLAHLHAERAAAGHEGLVEDGAVEEALRAALTDGHGADGGAEVEPDRARAEGLLGQELGEDLRPAEGEAAAAELLPREARRGVEDEVAGVDALPDGEEGRRRTGGARAHDGDLAAHARARASIAAPPSESAAAATRGPIG